MDTGEDQRVLGRLQQIHHQLWQLVQILHSVQPVDEDAQFDDLNNDRLAGAESGGADQREQSGKHLLHDQEDQVLRSLQHWLLLFHVHLPVQHLG